MTDLSDQKCLIIGGQPKAGTTSIVNWLADHPAFLPSHISEPRFFVDADYPIPSGQRFDGTNAAQYLALFERPAGKILLDSSPDYLFCKSPLSVAALMPKANILFVRRDPVERAVSWYRYAAQRGDISADLSFEGFIAAQKDPIRVPAAPVWQRALDQNRFDHYLAPFRAAFGERCHVLDFAQLRDDPRAAMKQVCAFAGADPTFFDSYEFSARNVTTGQASFGTAGLYNRLRAFAVYRLGLGPSVMRALRPASQAARRILSGPYRPLPRPVISEELAANIRQAAVE